MYNAFFLLFLFTFSTAHCEYTEALGDIFMSIKYHQEILDRPDISDNSRTYFEGVNTGLNLAVEAIIKDMKRKELIQQINLNKFCHN